MSKRRATPTELPPCYAVVHPGLEGIAAEEIAKDHGGEVKRTTRGMVVFRVPELSPSLLKLRTVEDVFLLAWGTEKLTHRAVDLKSITHWTDHDADWENLLRLHHAVRPKPKGKPTVRFITQMTGKNAYRRIDAREAFVRGLKGKFPASWKHAEENASLEVWLTIIDTTAVCGVRLSDRTMRHRTYKDEHLPASLRPTMAAAMVRLAEIRHGHVVLDPMCGAGTILAEAVTFARMRHLERVQVCGGDIERPALRAAGDNLRHLGEFLLSRWNAGELPLPDASVDRIISNPPFGKQLSNPEEIGELYEAALIEYDRVLRPGGRAVLLVSDPAAMTAAAENVGWKSQRSVRVGLLGQAATIGMWRKPG